MPRFEITPDFVLSANKSGYKLFLDTELRTIGKTENGNIKQIVVGTLAKEYIGNPDPPIDLG